MKYVKKRGNRYHYVRRVPNDIRHLEDREFIQISLKTDSLSLAQHRAAILDRSILKYWEMLFTSPDDALKQYQDAIKYVRFLGISHMSATDIAMAEIEDVVTRVKLAERENTTVLQSKAMLGAVDKPQLKLSECIDKYWSFSRDMQLGKSENQIRKWKNPRIKALRNFTAVTGDKPVAYLTRDDVLNFKDWWLNRIEDENLKPHSANKDFNHVRSILQLINDNLRLDLPILSLFERINIREDVLYRRLSFEPDFVQNTLLAANKLLGLDEELRFFIATMADTGARISELVGLDAKNGDINLEADVPYIHIRENKIRKLKNPHSNRVIPLVGASLYALQNVPQGFQSYLGRPDYLSTVLNKWFRENDILPSADHTLYSLRHCFQDRLIAIEAPERVQAELMGHKFHRPKYGAGASLEQKRDWLSKIAFEQC